MASQTASLSSYELRNMADASMNSPVVSHTQENVAENNEIEVPSLPPTDHGKAAYLVLLGCTVLQAPIWAYSLSFGVFQAYYTTQHPLTGSPSTLATIGTTLNGVIYLSMPLTFTLLTRYPLLRRYCAPLGLLLTIISLLLSSYATSIWHLILTQGVLNALGSGLLFAPTSLYLSEWFVHRKGMAYGVIWAGKSAAGVAFPFLTTYFLNTYGAPKTLRIWCIASTILTLPLLFVLKPRLPLPTSRSPRPLSFAFLKNPTFWTLQIGNVIQSFGYLLPSAYLPSYAHDLGLPNLTGAILVALFSLASTPGGIVHGILCDRSSPTLIILLSSLGSALAVFVFWGLATESPLPLLVVFALVYGFFAGGFSSTYPGVEKELKSQDEELDTGLVMGCLLGGRGVGYVVSGPVSGGLLGVWKAGGSWGGGNEYGGVVLVTGITAVLGGWGWGWKYGRKVFC
ncbi:MFS general substrate transporter [Glarea lozoyensis ATCC 20868]|uniref:MFS general substrate transporter n=1 Tax=Glarea lozoyensis (strain ATCC 20868 / MF5171) TaxID=1116229 RepID=S3CFM4_GLAL2|nr:MFS general substrate transporter [Glarea lozoyensis ATCC 20868]EPE24735.1 MFS general substrate transporter [Glarea lozoyensis ATCC 20868]